MSTIADTLNDIQNVQREMQAGLEDGDYRTKRRIHP